MKKLLKNIYHLLFGHRLVYEFDKKRFKDWRGDKWCTWCPYIIYSREAIRMQYFGLLEISNPT